MIPLVKSYLPPKKILMPELENVLYSGYIAQGEAVDTFEHEFAQFIGNKNCLMLKVNKNMTNVAPKRATVM